MDTPQFTVQEEDDRFMEKICEFTEGEPMDEKQAIEANNFRMYLAEQYIKPDKIVDVIVLGLNNSVVSANLKLYTMYHENPYQALADSIHNVIGIPIEILLHYVLYKVNNDDSLTKITNEDIPSLIIMQHPQIKHITSINDNQEVLNIYDQFQKNLKLVPY